MREASVFPVVFSAFCVALARTHEDGEGMASSYNAGAVIIEHSKKVFWIFQVKVLDLTLMFTFILLQTPIKMTIKGSFKKRPKSTLTRKEKM